VEEWMRFYSYAQEYEDIVLYIVLRGVNEIFYIDIGANDPTYLSVTKFFYLEGGHGINVEPLRDKCKALEEERTRDINLCIGVGASEGEMELICAGTGSTFSLETVKESGLENCSRHKKKILTLTQIYERYCRENQQVHFCKIDVEGYEKEVLEGCDFKIFRPWVFVIEAKKPGTTIPCYERWENILMKNGYIFGYESGINRYYVDSRKEHLLENFKNIKRFVIENEVVRMEMTQRLQSII